MSEINRLCFQHRTDLKRQNTREVAPLSRIVMRTQKIISSHKLRLSQSNKLKINT